MVRAGHVTSAATRILKRYASLAAPVDRRAIALCHIAERGIMVIAAAGVSGVRAVVGTRV
jgi:hypothetical protein